MSVERVKIEHQERDFALLRDLFISRVMTLAHIAELHFEGRAEAAKKRVYKLKSAGLMAERPRKARDPGVLYLTRAGFDLLSNLGKLADLPRLSIPSFERRAKVSELTIRHELAVMDVKSALSPAIAKTPGYSVTEFTTWPMMCEFDAQPRGLPRTRVKPDGRIRVAERTESGDEFEHTFFLEVDRGTEVLHTLVRRSQCYREHYASGGFAISCGGTRQDVVEYPFRVLIVLPSAARRDNLADCLLSLDQPILTQVWLTTMSDLLGNPLGPVWSQPRDRRDARMHGVISPRHAMFGNELSHPTSS